MSYQVSTCTAEGRPIAAVQTVLPLGAPLGDTILSSLDRVYHFLATSDVVQQGHNVVVYAVDAGSERMTVQAGVQVSAPFEPEGEVVCSQTPAGRAATTTHWGPYKDLVRAHEAVQAWCVEQGLGTREINWEVYGDWDPDPARLRTDVYYALLSGA